MGQTGARIGLGICTLGLSEAAIAIINKLTPQQQAQWTRTEKDLEKLKKEMDDMMNSNMENYVKNEEKFYTRQLKLVAEGIPDIPKTEVFSCAMLGQTSAGKSSIINAVYGLNERVDYVVCTVDIKLVVDRPDFQLCDVYGSNDEQSYQNTKQLLAIKKLHKVCCVYIGAVESCLRLARLLKALKVPAVFFRNKEDTIPEADRIRVQKMDQATLQKISPGYTVIVGSAHANKGLTELKAALR